MKTELQQHFDKCINKALSNPPKRKQLQDYADYLLNNGVDSLVSNPAKLAECLALLSAHFIPKITTKKIKDNFDLAAFVIDKKSQYGTKHVYSNGEYVYGTDGHILVKTPYELEEGWYCPLSRKHMTEYNKKPPTFENIITIEVPPLDDVTFNNTLSNDNKTQLTTVEGIDTALNKKVRLTVNKKYIDPYLPKISKLGIGRGELVKIQYAEDTTIVVMGLRDTYNEELL